MEVLGTVLGTAIQGQIVGQADTPCLQDPNGSALASEGTNHTQSATSLKETVRPLAAQGSGEMRHNGVVCSHPQHSEYWAFALQTVNMPTFLIILNNLARVIELVIYRN